MDSDIENAFSEGNYQKAKLLILSQVDEDKLHSNFAELTAGERRHYINSLFCDFSSFAHGSDDSEEYQEFIARALAAFRCLVTELSQVEPKSLWFHVLLIYNCSGILAKVQKTSVVLNILQTVIQKHKIVLRRCARSRSLLEYTITALQTLEEKDISCKQDLLQASTKENLLLKTSAENKILLAQQSLVCAVELLKDSEYDRARVLLQEVVDVSITGRVPYRLVRKLCCLLGFVMMKLSNASAASMLKCAASGQDNLAVCAKFYLAKCCANQGQYAQCMSTLKEVLLISTNAWIQRRALENLVKCCEHAKLFNIQGKFLTILNSFVQAKSTSIAPSRGTILKELGLPIWCSETISMCILRALILAKNYEGAIDYMSAGFHGSEKLPGQRAHAFILLRTSRYQEAASILDDVRKIHPQDCTSMLYLAHAMWGLGSIKESCKFLDAVIEVTEGLEDVLSRAIKSVACHNKAFLCAGGAYPLSKSQRLVQTERLLSESLRFPPVISNAQSELELAALLISQLRLQEAKNTWKAKVLATILSTQYHDRESALPLGPETVVSKRANTGWCGQLYVDQYKICEKFIAETA